MIFPCHDYNLVIKGTIKHMFGHNLATPLAVWTEFNTHANWMNA